MVEKFDGPDWLDGLTEARRLDEGVYLERIGRAPETAEYAEDEGWLVYGDARADGSWWRDAAREMQETGCMDPDGTMTWQDMKRFFQEQGWLTEEESRGSLELLAEILDEGDKALCTVNDCVLEHLEAGKLPGLTANMVVSVENMDLSCPEREIVTLVRTDREETRLEQYPLSRFLHAWRTGGQRMLAIQRGNGL